MIPRTFGRKQFEEGYFFKFVDNRNAYSHAHIHRIDSDEGRTYVVPSGKEYPSMSRVVGIQGKEVLEQWRARVGEEVAKEISTNAARRGTRVHLLAELFITDKQELFKEMYAKSSPQVHANWEGLKKALIERLGSVEAIECQLFSDELRLAGTTDCIGVWDGKLSVIDFKTSSKNKPREWIDSYFMQTDGYGQMWKERTGNTVEQCVIIICNDESKEPQIFVEPFGASMSKMKKARAEFYKVFGI